MSTCYSFGPPCRRYKAAFEESFGPIVAPSVLFLSSRQSSVQVGSAQLQKTQWSSILSPLVLSVCHDRHCRKNFESFLKIFFVLELSCCTDSAGLTTPARWLWRHLDFGVEDKGGHIPQTRLSKPCRFHLCSLKHLAVGSHSLVCSFSQTFWACSTVLNKNIRLKFVHGGKKAGIWRERITLASSNWDCFEASDVPALLWSFAACSKDCCIFFMAIV